MADGGHFGFDDTRIVAKIMDKHLIDFSFIFPVQVRNSHNTCLRKGLQAKDRIITVVSYFFYREWSLKTLCREIIKK